LGRWYKKRARKILLRHFPELAWKLFAGSQNDDRESIALSYYAKEFSIHPSFIEFGFHPYEYNSVSLTKLDFDGLLLDGSQATCDLANMIFSRLNLRTSAAATWITINSLDPIVNFVKKNDGFLGALSVDVDGNDYWILKALLSKFKPEIICVEHNASFGLRPITVPYSDDFDRHKHHKSGWYHGASITAFEKLLNADYALIENILGVNLIFVRRDKITANVIPLTASEAYKECFLRNEWSGTNAEFQWQAIKEMPFVEV